MKPCSNPKLCLLIAALLIFLAPQEADAKKRNKKKSPTVLEGLIVDEGGQPVEGVQVLVTTPDDEGFRAEAKSDRKGTFSLEFEDPRAQYVYTLSKDGHDPLITTQGLEAGKRQGLTFTLPTMNSPEARKRRAVESYNAGVQAFNSKDRDTARAKFVEAAELDPELVEPRVALGELLIAEEDHEGALNAANEILALDADNANGRRIRFEAARHLGDSDALEEAIAGLDEAVAANSAIVVFNEGVGATQGGDHDTAYARFQLAAQLKPDLHQAYTGMSSIAFNQGNYAGTLEAIDKLLALKPADTHGLRLRYLAYHAQGQDEQASEALKALTEADPTAALGELTDRADLLFRENNFDAAKAAAEEALKIDPENVPAHYTLGLCALNGGDKTRARELLEKVIALAPDSQKGKDAKEMLTLLQ